MKNDDMTWKAAISSEVFREYASMELNKEAVENSNETKLAKAEAEAEQSAEVYEALDNFEKQILASPSLKAKFKRAKEYLINNPDVISKVDSNFVNGIMMLNLED